MEEESKKLKEENAKLTDEVRCLRSAIKKVEYDCQEARKLYDEYYEKYNSMVREGTVLDSKITNNESEIRFLRKLVKNLSKALVK